jgi:hypothetical protein
VQPAAQLQNLKPQLIAQALAHHSVRNDSQDLQVMVTKANSICGAEVTESSTNKQHHISQGTWYMNVTWFLLRNCANRHLFNCLWYEERPKLQILKMTCRISSATSPTAL